MTTEPTGAPVPVEPPPMPTILLEPWPVVVVFALVWLVALVVAFTIGGFEGWRPVTIAGVGTGALGTSIFRWQRSAVRRGAKGAQRGLR